MHIWHYKQCLWFSCYCPGGCLNIKMSSYQYRIPILKIRRSHDRFFFITKIPTPAKTSLYSLIARSMGQHGAHLGPTGPRWAPCLCWPHELCWVGTVPSFRPELQTSSLISRQSKLSHIYFPVIYHSFDHVAQFYDKLCLYSTVVFLCY